MELIYWDNEYYSKDEVREQLKQMRTVITELNIKHNELLEKHEILKAEFEQLKERYINLVK